MLSTWMLGKVRKAMPTHLCNNVREGTEMAAKGFSVPKQLTEEVLPRDTEATPGVAEG